MAVTCSLPGNKENLINTFYKKKKQQRNPLNSKAEKTACIAKMLKIIYGMCKIKTYINTVLFVLYTYFKKLEKYNCYVKNNQKVHLFIVFQIKKTKYKKNIDL